MNLYSLFLENFSPKKKIVFNNDEISYEKFKDYVNFVALKISNKKYKKIAYITNNQKLLSIILLACAKEGKTLITINSSLKIIQINSQLQFSNPDIIIIDDRIRLKEIGLKSQIYFSKNIFNFLNLKKMKNKNLLKNNLNKDYIVTFSSGTTSNPKPILFTQKIKYKRFIQMRKIFKIKKKDTILSVSPIDHSLGQRMLLLAILNGNNFVHINNYNFKDIKEKIHKYKITFTVLPSNYISLLKKKLINKSIFIKKIVSASSTITNYEKRSLLSKGVNLYEMYGSSEVGTTTSINFKLKKNKINTVGKILSGVDLKIINGQGKFLSKGKIGEIVCKTSLRFKGYYNNKKLTKNSFVGNFFKTGDIGKIDRDNYLYFISRKQDVIISSGKNIYPIDIEKEIIKLNYVKEVAVIGINDKFFGEAAYAVCVLKNKINGLEYKIQKFLNLKLSKYQIPLGYDFVKKLPKNNLGKIQKNILRSNYNRKKIDLTKKLRLILN
jgi:acyl-coenzyme A synthetase/AMP-(fatty) acid ligase